MSDLPLSNYVGFIEDDRKINITQRLKFYKASIKSEDPENPREHSDWSKFKGDYSFGEKVSQLNTILWNEDTTLRGVPRIGIIMPHVSAVYRIGSKRIEGEVWTNFYRSGLYRTNSMENILNEIDPNTPHVQIGCPVELYVINEERKFLAESGTALEYMKKEVKPGDYPGNRVKNPRLGEAFFLI